jgi:hypothetical protein
MNKIYGIIAIFAFAGLLIPTSAMQIEAVSDLDYMLTIAEKGKKYIKSKIDKMDNSNSKILDLYGQSTSEINKLSIAIKDGDVKSARNLFVSSMSNLKQISLMLNQIQENKSQDSTLPNQLEIIKRYEMNMQKLKQISDKINANIDFSDMESLLSLAKQNNDNGNIEKTKQTLDKIALNGLQTYKTLQSLNEENKIIRAQALAEKYVDKINTLIVMAKNSGLVDHVKQLENSKIQLISANSTSQITKNIKIIITINNDITKIDKNNLKQIDANEIKLSQTQQLTAELNKLENKAKLLHSEAIGSNAALYYVEKALSIIDNIRNNLDDSEKRITSKIQQIEQLLLKSQKILQEST